MTDKQRRLYEAAMRNFVRCVGRHPTKTELMELSGLVKMIDSDSRDSAEVKYAAKT